ncbi:hypothetical protein U1Q18_022530 [Sarracenia purpurea var. burkii]
MSSPVAIGSSVDMGTKGNEVNTNPGESTVSIKGAGEDLGKYTPEHNIAGQVFGGKTQLEDVESEAPSESNVLEEEDGDEGDSEADEKGSFCLADEATETANL